MWTSSTRSASPPRSRPLVRQPQSYGSQQSQHHHQYYKQQQALQQQQLIETKYLLTRQGPLGSSSQSSAAASFFAKAHHKLNVHSNQGSRSRDSSSEERDPFPTCFCTIVHRSPPPIPSFLLKRLDNNDNNNNNSGHGDQEDHSTSSTPAGGRIKILLRVAPSQSSQNHDNFFNLDKRKRQITLYDPASIHRTQSTPSPSQTLLSAPKMFAFDGVFSSHDSQEEISSSALVDAIHSVMNGKDGTIFCFGHANLGKSRTMIGSDECSKDLGIIPTAIAWLYRAIKDRKAKSGARFSVRVSALEILSNPEEVQDLLSSYESATDGTSPGVYLANETSHLANISELRAASPEKAAFYLDASLAARSQEEKSHFLFTIHLYQYTMDNNNYSAYGHGGRSRLHLIDFGSCDRTRSHPYSGITLSGLGNAILGIFNGQKHIPHRESKVTQILKECLGSLHCNATIIAHISSEPSHYSETLHTVSVSSRLHRVRRKRMKSSSRLKSRSRLHQGSSSSDFTTTSGTSTNVSSSDLSCDTVVYRGGGSDSSGTDNEHPPSSILYGVRSLRAHHSAPNSLKGSYDDIPRPRRRTSGSKILTNGAISPRHNLSPTPTSSSRGPRSSHSSSLLLPSIPETTSKMPLNGRVPVRRQGAIQNKNSNSSSEEVSKAGRSSNTKYGYMDDHKASMINTWVEKQSTPVFQALTQFKTCDDEEITHASNKIQAQVHVMNEAKKESDKITFWSNKSLQTTLSEEKSLMSKKTREEDRTEKKVVIVDDGDDDDIPPLPPPPPMEPMTLLGTEQHPLRILSEENLTIVSSFGGSLNDIPRPEDEEEIEEKRLLEEYNKVMETFLINSNEQHKLMEFSEIKDIDRFYGNLNNNNNSLNNTNHHSSVTQVLFNNNNDNYSNNTENNINIKNNQDLLSPQKQFKLLGQSLRHPDGSSNPELNNEQHTISDLYNNNNSDSNGKERSPGNGQSDPEEINGNCNDRSIEVPDEVVEEEEEEVKEAFSKKETSRFSFRIFKFFKSNKNNNNSQKGGNTNNNGSHPRSKSCERHRFLENNKVLGLLSKKTASRSETASPVIKAPDTESVAPSVMSMDTEWEYQQQSQSQQQTSFLYPQPPPPYVNTKYGVVSGDRKSSGYDSIGGESSSLDSNEDAQLHRSSSSSHQPGGVTLKSSSSSSCSSVLKSSFSNNYAVPSSSTTSPLVLEYDELDILRMESRLQKI
ncbi:uncharacterized protein [Lepeophtheirus salmonis]|uniref:uncharacterized protein n=1 Tax=Lepeophtheirus salmonis TaxID=72036 RepID=UPI001AEB4BB7|nr:putative mediator of RNA polymerase II transcription subunit 26 [Lepeophtheirus salmonis]